MLNLLNRLINTGVEQALRVGVDGAEPSSALTPTEETSAFPPVKIKLLSIILLTTLVSSATGNPKKTFETQIALQEPIIRQQTEAENRHREWLQQQENIEEQRQQRQQLRNQQYEQKLQTHDRKIEQSRQQVQQQRQNQNELRQQVQQRRQQYQDELKRRQLLRTPTNQL